MSTILLLPLLVFLTLILESSCQPLGDVSLRCPGGNPSLPSTGGYVTVYQPAVQQYVPVCQSGFNRAAAAAVCRQIGYVDAERMFSGGSQYFGDPSELNCDPYQNFTRLSHVLCSTVSNYILNGELHIMRCSVGSVINTSCPIVAVQCSNTQLHVSTEYVYNGQVYLHGSSQEYYKGSLRVRLSDEYHAVCVDKFNTQTATSICRQLGYTTGSYHAGEIATESPVDLTTIVCNTSTGSFLCFSHCINKIGYSSTDRDCHEVYIDCDFQIDDSLTHTEGTRDQCRIQVDGADSSIIIRDVSIALGVVSLAFVGFICLCCVFSCYVVSSVRQTHQKTTHRTTQ